MNYFSSYHLLRAIHRRDLSSANLQFLSADQALADLAYFIEYLIEKGDLSRGQKVAVFGGSYPGNLAAWARIKYPHLIHAAVSSSAPVHAEADFPGELPPIRECSRTVRCGPSVIDVFALYSQSTCKS